MEILEPKHTIKKKKKTPKTLIRWAPQQNAEDRSSSELDERTINHLI